MAPYSSTLAWKNPMDGGAWWAAVHGVAKSRTRLSDFTFTFHFHALEKEMATHSSVLAWRIPETEESGGLPTMGSHRVGHDWSDLAAAAAVVLISEIIIILVCFCSWCLLAHTFCDGLIFNLMFNGILSVVILWDPGYIWISPNMFCFCLSKFLAITQIGANIN